MERRYELLKHLIANNKLITNHDLQKQFSVSRRTVINYINQLNKEAAEIILSTPNGYSVRDYDAAKKLLADNQDEAVPDDYESRKTYMIENLLLTSRYPQIDQMAADLCISLDTLNGFFLKFQKELKENHLFLKRKNNHAYVIGEDKYKRKYILKMLEHEMQDSRFSIQFIQKFFTFVSLEKIQFIVDTVLNQNKLFLDDYSKINYILHLGILLESKNTSTPIHTVDEEPPAPVDYPAHFTYITEEIYTLLANLYPYGFTLADIQEVSILMTTRIISSEYLNTSFQQLRLLVGDELNNLVEKIVSSVYQTYGIRLDTNDFMVRFALHLKNMLTRLRSSILIPNNQFISLKEDFPFLYLIASYIASVISAEEHVAVTENEISYIALHLGVLMEQEKACNQKFNCTLVLYNYYSLGESIINEISQYTKELHFTNIVTSYDQIASPESIDLIITTLPLETRLEIPQVRINLIPTSNDMDSVLHMVRQLKKELSNREIVATIHKFFKKDLFSADTEFSDYQEVLSFMGKKMMEKNYVGADFEKAIWEHEKTVSSAYANIAVPHPLSDTAGSANQSAIYVLINKNPISWLQNQVDFVFMISLRPEDKSYFREIFDLLIKTVSLPETKKRIRTCQDFDAFVGLLIEASKHS